ncbi:MAG TPA: rod shape-determining protein MreC, partial [Gammaproteobacteria bacterium]|nr:rod shape-determining protein MreC [Gammaproteobacteria bacterium]
NAAIPVEVVRNGLRTIAIGVGDSRRLELPYLPNNADIKSGDRLVTSGLGGRFPRGYPVGAVMRVLQKPGAPFAEIEAQPAAELARSHQVLLLWPPKPDHAPAKTAVAEAGTAAKP